MTRAGHAGFALDDGFWSEFAAANWEREPTVLRQPFARPLLHEEEILRLVTAMADRYRSQGALHRQQASGGDTVRLNVENALQMTDVGPLLPAAADESLVAYVERVGAAVGGRPFEVVANDIQAHDIELLKRLRAFLGGACRQVGLPGLKSEAVLFLRDHETTSFGVHHDDAGVFMFLLHGEKRILTWSADQIARRPGTVLTTDYDDIRDQATVLEGRPGDVIYWPSSSWHVGESNRGLSASVSVAMRLGQPPMTEVAGCLTQLVEQAGANEAITTFADTVAHDTDDGALPEPVATAIAVAAGAVDSGALAEAMATRWLNRRSADGFTPVPPPAKLRYLGDDDVVAADRDFPMLLAARGGGRLACAAHGQSFTVPAGPSPVAVVERLNTGEPVRLGDLLDDHGPAAGPQREALRLLVAELVARHGVEVVAPADDALR